VKRKVRGPTRCTKIINLQEGEKLNVEFDKDFQAIGKNATQFIWFLGQTVRSRSCCPLKVNGWKEIEQDKIDHMWDIILVRKTFVLTLYELTVIETYDHKYMNVSLLGKIQF